MNILVFSWRDPKHPLAGGAEQVMHEHMKGWMEAGHSVTLFCSSFKGGAKIEALDGIRIIRKSFQYGGVHFFAALYYLFGKHKKYDLVVDQFHGPPFFTPLYVRVPKLAVLQEVTREVFLLYPLPKIIKLTVGRLAYCSEPLFFLFYRKVPFMVGSSSAKDDLIKFHVPAKNITVVPHGLILDLPKKLPSKEKVRTIVFFGAHTHDKGVEDAIKAFSILNKTGKYQFWTIGKGEAEYVAQMKSLAKSLGIGKKITFWGFVDQKKKFELLARAHVILNPSVREGFGLVNIEANSVGTPVIAYKSPGLVDSIKNNYSGVITVQNTPEQLAIETEKLLENTKKYEKLSRSSIKWSKNFQWEKSKKLSLELLANLTK